MIVRANAASRNAGHRTNIHGDSHRSLHPIDEEIGHRPDDRFRRDPELGWIVEPSVARSLVRRGERLREHPPFRCGKNDRDGKLLARSFCPVGSCLESRHTHRRNAERQGEPTRGGDPGTDAREGTWPSCHCDMRQFRPGDIAALQCFRAQVDDTLGVAATNLLNDPRPFSRVIVNGSGARRTERFDREDQRG